jgi:hypothetical protein
MYPAMYPAVLRRVAKFLTQLEPTEMASAMATLNQSEWKGEDASCRDRKPELFKAMNQRARSAHRALTCGSMVSFAFQRPDCLRAKNLRAKNLCGRPKDAALGTVRKVAQFKRPARRPESDESNSCIKGMCTIRNERENAGRRTDFERPYGRFVQCSAFVTESK